MMSGRNQQEFLAVTLLQPSAPQDMKGRSSQQVDDRRRVNTAFRSLNTDQQAVEMSTRGRPDGVPEIGGKNRGKNLQFFGFVDQIPIS